MQQQRHHCHYYRYFHHRRRHHHHHCYHCRQHKHNLILCSPARAVLDKRKNDLKNQKAREIGSIIQTATSATAVFPLEVNDFPPGPIPSARPPAKQIPRGGGAVMRKPPPFAPLDAQKTKLPFDPLPPPPPPPKIKEPPPPPPKVRMARERVGEIPLAEKLEPGDVDLGKASGGGSALLKDMFSILPPNFSCCPPSSISSLSSIPSSFPSSARFVLHRNRTLSQN